MKDIEKLAEELGNKYHAEAVGSEIEGDWWPEDWNHPSIAFQDGFITGYQHCRAEVKEQIEAVIVELDKIRKDHAGLGIVKVLLRGIG